jgi:hypothetical protein
VSSYWPGPWSGEDGGPSRRQTAAGPSGLGIGISDRVEVTSRSAPAATMVVTGAPGDLYLLRHTGGDGAISFVERIDPRTLQPRHRSPDLAGGPTWPGSVAVHANGSIYVVFGNHAHRLAPDLSVTASVALPRPSPYNGFLLMPDGCLVTKDFAGSRPGTPVPVADRRPCQLVVLEPEHLEVVDTCTLSEPSIARLSADGDMVYVVGDTSLLRVRWDAARHALVPDDRFRARYRTMEGQTYGWDCVLAAGAAWFLDDGDGSHDYSGTLRGHGRSSAPLHLVRVDLESGGVTMAEVCGLPGGLIANPPVIDPVRSIAVAYDSGNGVIAAFDIGGGGRLAPRWQRRQDHGAHLLLFAATGELLTGDYDGRRGADQAVILDIGTGDEILRVDTGSPVQSVLFPALGFERDVYLCSFTTVTRVSVETGEPTG